MTGRQDTEPASIAVSHVGLCVADLARAERFYTEALGFVRIRELSPPDGVTGQLLRISGPVGCTAVYLGHGSFVLELLHFDRDGNDAARERSFTEPGLTHISLTVSDLAATLSRVVEYGGTVLEDTNVSIAALFLDPDGQILELVQGR